MRVYLEDLSGAAKMQEVDNDEVRQAGNENECIMTVVIQVQHPDFTTEDLVRYYGFHRLTAGDRGLRVYRELSPKATARIIAGEVCAAYYSHPQAPCVCDRRPIQYYSSETNQIFEREARRMSDTKRTPGPWKLADSYAGFREIWGPHISEEECASVGSLYDANDADAALIAAAPDLLEACEALYKIVSNHSLADDRQSHVWEVRLRAWDVIAKARGGV